MISLHTKSTALAWCRKYEVLFRVIAAEEVLQRSLRRYSGYSRPLEYCGLIDILDECLHEAYDAGVVVTDYQDIIRDTGISEKDVEKPTEDWAETLAAEQLLACMAWHFRADYYNNGSWICDSVANGHMLVLVESYIRLAGE